MCSHTILPMNISYCRMQICVIPKSIERQPLTPISRMRTSKNSQVPLNLLSDSLSLSNNSRVIRKAHVQVRTNSFDSCLPKIACEDWVPIRHNELGHAMKFINIVQQRFSNFLSRKRCFKAIKWPYLVNLSMLMKIQPN